MPLLQAMSMRANFILNRDRIGNIELGALDADTLPGLATNLEIATNDNERAYLGAWPPTLQEGLRATLVSAINRRQPVTVSWAPAYDYQITLWEAADTDVSPGGLTILLQGRYPGDNPIPGM